MARGPWTGTTIESAQATGNDYDGRGGGELLGLTAQSQPGVYSTLFAAVWLDWVARSSARRLQSAAACMHPFLQLSLCL